LTVGVFSAAVVPKGRPRAIGSIATLPGGPGAWPGATPVVLPSPTVQVEVPLFGAMKAFVDQLKDDSHCLYSCHQSARFSWLLSRPA
jgi:hypothetical protein